jgi:high-affinity iron transporter
MRLIWIFLSLTLLAVRVAEAESPPVQVTWRLLDYVAVDYAGAVADGKVISEAEYEEMNEFASAARARIEALPESEAKPQLIERAKALQAAIAACADSAEVARTSRDLAGSLIAAYPIPMAPSAAPDPVRGAALYQELCSSCHGASGDGHGPAAANLDPPPIAFTDVDRARERSIFGLYQVIEQGLDGTSMPSFASLDAMDR